LIDELDLTRLQLGEPRLGLGDDLEEQTRSNPGVPNE
jgi:hypothetical protein